MKLYRIAWSICAALCLSTPVTAQSPAPSTVSRAERTASGVTFQTPQGTLRIEPWGERIIHVVAFRNAAWKGAYNPAVIARPGPVSWTTSETAEAYIVSTPVLSVRVAREDGSISFRTADDKVVLEEAPGQRTTPKAGDSGEAVSQGFKAPFPHFDAVFGLGQHPNGLLNQAGNTVHLQQANRDVAVPMLVSRKGFGILWNNASVTDVDVDVASAASPLLFRSEAGGGIDYHFIYGPALDDVVAGYRHLTGDAPMMARWTWGLWQSKERYQTQQELLDVAAHYRSLRIPIDAVVQDWQYWRPGGWGSHEMDPARFPDPKAMMKTLHDANIHAIVSVWPRFDLDTANGKALDRAGALFPKVYGNVYPAGEGRWYDAYSPAGRDLYWRQIMATLGQADFDGWWLDGSEAELGGRWGELRSVRTAAGPGERVYNAYPLLHTTGVHDGMRRDMPGKRALILTRSAYAGQQRNGAITWSGDTTGSWDHFRRQLPEALNFSLSGIPYWSADIGGFFGGNPQDPAYAELFTRWFQFGVFNPMFRVHGTSDAKELWRFPPGTMKRLLAYDELRYRLLPYIYSLSWDVTHKRGTMMRPLVMDFQDDPEVADIPDQYMFGRALLINPVTRKGATLRSVYLPGTQPWYDFWTGDRYEPGRILAAKADIDTIPVFVRAGAILPLGPVVQYADEKSAEPIELRIYPGADGRFLLYDDAGDGHGYEAGQYATVDLSWHDAKHSLTLGPRRGTFPGMAKEQRFRIRCGASRSSSSATVSYTGREMVVPLQDCR
jgi:alpha-D-xyloside xylohydrolase